MRLIVTEKDRMAFNIARALGKYSVSRYGRVKIYNVDNAIIFPLKGHIMNYVTRKDLTYWSYSSIDKILSDPYSIVKIISSKGYYQPLRKIAEKCDEIIIATDPDEEGENIGLEVIEILKDLAKPVKRLWLSSTQPQDIRNAFNQLREFNEKLALSVEARRKIDSITGFAGTRELTLRLKTGREIISFGRVQTSTLWLIVKREREIESFQPKPYWEIIADVEGNIFNHIDSPFFDKSKAFDTFNRLKDVKIFECSKIERKEYTISPPRPLNTAEMLKVASSLMHLSPRRIMEIAEKLYLYGRITYPRVDNQAYSSSFNHRSNLEKLLKTNLASYVSQLLKRNILQPSKGRYSEDHEPITPIAPISEISDKFSLRLYEIILRHYLAIFGPHAKFLYTRIEGKIGQDRFSTEAKELTDRGFYEIYYFKPEEKKLNKEFKEGAKYSVNAIYINEKKTKPPPRFTYQSLLAEMEKCGIGTKSTRPQMIDILKKRGYIEVRSLTIYPTEKGKKLIAEIEDKWKDYISPEFTARVQQEMEKIAEGKKDWSELVESERVAFSEALKKIRNSSKESSQTD